jgi:hypothetical protein
MKSSPMTRRHGARAAPLVFVLSVAMAATLDGCAATSSTFPPLGSTPQPAGDATTATQQAVAQALGRVGLQASVSVRPYRPPEGPLLTAAPRTVLEVPLQNDPEPAVIAIYALATPEAANAAARDQADYIRSNVGGGIQMAPGTRVVLQVLGSNVVYFSWLPADSPDPATATIAQALASVGQPMSVTP